MSLSDKFHTTFKWTVSNYATLLTSINPQTKSANFVMAEDPKIEWVLVLKIFVKTSASGNCYCCSQHGWTCYQTRSGKRIISLYLENCKANEEPVSFNVAFSILDANNDKIFTRKKQFSGVIVNGKQYGFDNFISETELSVNLPLRNSLNILCEIKPIDDTSSSEHLSFLKGFDSFINDETFSDVVLFIGEKKIYAHKLILSCSPVFRQMFLTDMKESNSNEAKVNDIKFEVFNELLRFMYTGNVEKLDELGLEIFKAAHFYQIDDLKLICEHVLRKTLNIENSIDVLKLADDHNAEVLKEHCVAFILKNFKAVMKTAAFKNLSKSHPHLPFELLIQIGSQFLK